MGMTLRDEFVTAFGVWEEALPYLHLMVAEEEMRLIVALGKDAIPSWEVAGRLGVDTAQAEALLAQAYGRCLVDRREEERVTYQAGTFEGFLDYFAKFGAWDEVPPGTRRTLDHRFLAEFVSRQRPRVEAMAQGREMDEAPPNDTVLLLGEVEEMICAASHIVVQPCDCRRLGQNCERPVETCIWLDELALESLRRGHGRRLSREEAVELVRWADRRGLMHTADGEWQRRGLHAICNCCACDCYPFRAAQELGSKGTWPRSRYVAVHDGEACNLCGSCVRRCHFEAFYHDGSTIEIDGKVRANVLYDPERCWGCGLCANTCPTEAIVMERLSGEEYDPH
jgi:NAD-dependent dihydropyrimidine dehydrogenase PreA subunit